MSSADVYRYPEGVKKEGFCGQNYFRNKQYLSEPLNADRCVLYLSKKGKG